MDTLELRRLRLQRQGLTVLDGVDLTVAAGERLALLGPSGAGKSTLLRVVAGLEPPSSGAVLLGGVDVTSASPGERDVVFVAEDAPLLDHLDVERNLGFPLRVRRRPAEEVADRTRAEGRAFGITHLFRRRPRQLAAGEHSTVTLARSLVRRGRVLLLDEPFSRLDVHRRDELAHELVAVQQGYGVTTVIATHDQRTAGVVADRVAVLDGGRLRQVDRLQALFDRPADTFVARFVGEPPMNLLPGVLGERVDPGASRVAVVPSRPGWRPSGTLLVGVRPTALAPWRATDACQLAGTVRTAAFVGAAVEVRLDTPAGEVVAVLATPGPRVGDSLTLGAPARAVHLFDAVTGRALRHGV
ncbi:ABC transporter ATP-binding protein [Egicoccus halophilus]|uniref:sn-glycerol-3-phosphate import ATP-binding protein UgpC n=1 Tax=Egicoccus halophilus TaxID=1670830 RepID=A0A8J3ACT0_9ACTN|nr:ABC transporter ATP-binding protein [Egicoccus halophilus]GGI04005.1 sn-glycerol-3-phosphate import ATP-binding protein UgpC [Egicoccus halophilus]